MTADATAPRILLLPGWLDSDATHWQSRWEALHGDHRVQQDDWQWPRRGDWMARLDEELLASDTPALLVAPPDAERDDMVEKGYTAKQVRLLCEWYLRVRKSS